MVRLSALPAQAGESRYAGFSGQNGRRSSLGRSRIKRAVGRQKELAADARVGFVPVRPFGIGGVLHGDALINYRFDHPVQRGAGGGDTLKRLQAGTAAELTTLLPAIPGRAFKEDYSSVGA